MDTHKLKMKCRTCEKEIEYTFPLGTSPMVAAISVRNEGWIQLKDSKSGEHCGYMCPKCVQKNKAEK